MSKDDVKSSDTVCKNSRITDSPKEDLPDGNAPINVDEATNDDEKTDVSEKIMELDKSSQVIQPSVETKGPGKENNSSNGNDYDGNTSSSSNEANSDNKNKSTERIKQ